jgi:hypothetical protein
MSKLLFTPFRISTGLLAGLLGKRALDRIWARIDEQGPPKPEDRRAGLGKLALALALEGALLRVVRGLVDHESRRGFAVLTGSWPGEEQEEESEDPRAERRK